MIEYENNDYGIDNLFPKPWLEWFYRFVFGFLLFQNILLFVSWGSNLFYGTIAQKTSWALVLFKFSLYLDIIGFFLAMLLAVGFLVVGVKRGAWALVLVGSLFFILGSLAWRPVMDFFPKNTFSDFLKDVFMGDIQPTGTLDLSDINRVQRGLLISNFGLLLFSIGLYFWIPSDRKGMRILVLLYGVLNLMTCFYIIFIPLKPFYTVPLIIYVFLVFVTNPWFE